MIMEEMKRNLQVLVDSALEAKEASTNEESKPENKYDTRGLEASYLASGQAQRAQQLKEKIFYMEQVQLKTFGPKDPVTISALVELEMDQGLKKWFFLLPIGGLTVEMNGVSVQSMTQESPIGEALVNSFVDDEIEVNGKYFLITQVL